MEFQNLDRDLVVCISNGVGSARKTEWQCVQLEREKYLHNRRSKLYCSLFKLAY